jgi:hypothetical protein
MNLCRGCSSELSSMLIDLGEQPIANNLLNKPQMDQIEDHPLQVMICGKCGLVQLSESLSREDLFTEDYVYYSSFSKSWLKHSRDYAESMIKLLSLHQNDLVIEVGSNDGYLLQYFLAHKIKVLGIEPSQGVAGAALRIGIPTIIEFFDLSIAKHLSKFQKPKLIIANNVLAHVPNLHSFIESFSLLIAEEGLITFEFPHLLNLIKNNQFDTIYHEHYSYLSVSALIPIFNSFSLKIVNIEKLETHGGSLRVYVSKKSSKFIVSQIVNEIITEENMFDPRLKEVSESFRSRVLNLKQQTLMELEDIKNKDLKIAAYSASAKGVTFLNFCGISTNLIEFVVDINPVKQEKYLPRSLIPVVSREYLDKNIPDVLLILSWNLSDEIKKQLFPLVNKGLKLMRAIPRLEYF